MGARSSIPQTFRDEIVETPVSTAVFPVKEKMEANRGSTAPDPPTSTTTTTAATTPGCLSRELGAGNERLL
ncbi:unnamed protein product [Ophioblennius macclurei]